MRHLYVSLFPPMFINSTFLTSLVTWKTASAIGVSRAQASLVPGDADLVTVILADAVDVETALVLSPWRQQRAFQNVTVGLTAVQMLVHLHEACRMLQETSQV